MHTATNWKEEHYKQEIADKTKKKRKKTYAITAAIIRIAINCLLASKKLLHKAYNYVCYCNVCMYFYKLLYAYM